MPHSVPSSSNKPRVLIVGAGLGGLTLALLLLKGGIPFLIVERAKEVRPLGSALSLGANLARLLEQIGLLEEFKAIGKPYTQVKTLDGDLNSLFTMDFTGTVDIGNSKEYIVARPDLYDMLWRQIPREYILMQKKVLSFEQNDEGVTIRCSDNSEYVGDILVGADGAYSAVRQNLYKELKLAKKLPASDDVPLPFSCVCLVGQTTPQNPEDFPHLQLELSQFITVLGENNTYKFLTKETSKSNDSFRNSEWGPEAAEVMCKEVRHFKVPGGKDGQILTIGDLIDRTPNDLISKVMLEEKIFDTWYGGRTVLLGDACHKLNPAGGAGALSAMHDAIALANWICAVQKTDVPELEKIFREYYVERLPSVQAQFATSNMLKNVGGKTITAAITRAVFKRSPAWLWRKVMTKRTSERPIVSFLPLVEDQGSVKPKYQPSLHKTLAIHEHKRAAAI
ncbi:hypothetical protein BG006_000810 [Podila minutissima]|uniref:FAD-binding domain-containing protein n=1 Tax=Podila minutissima TaxID=64525 RepID=A0A9P5VHL6_9FUNG|nr:hypothetical protein BG006_000810 [Podila minutissima]